MTIYCVMGSFEGYDIHDELISLHESRVSGATRIKEVIGDREIKEEYVDEAGCLHVLLTDTDPMKRHFFIKPKDLE